MIEHGHLPERQLISSMFVGVQRDGDTGENPPSNRNEVLVAHIMPTVTAIPLFLFQMAKLNSSISIYFGGVVARTEVLKTYMRSASNSEFELMLRKPKL